MSTTPDASDPVRKDPGSEDRGPEDAEPAADPAAKRGICPNCHQSVTGSFCHHCGQRRNLRPLSLPALLWELLVEILDTDARIWRTLRTLILRPGQLTLDWMQGRRARHVPPFRLYLVLNLIAFLVISVQAGPFAGAEVVRVQGENAPEQLRARIETLETRGRRGDAERIERLQEALQLLEERRPGAAGGDDADPSGPRLVLRGGDMLDALLDWLQGFGVPRDRLEARANELMASPEDLVEGVIEQIPTVMAALLPIMATVLWLLYLLSGRPWVVHLVGVAHLHAFVFLLVLLLEGFTGFVGLLEALSLPVTADAFAATTVWAGPAALMLYLVLWLRRLYGHRWRGAVVIAGLIFTLHLAAILIAMLTLLLITFVIGVLG